jgi:ABC-type multidrug transport system, ATPase component
MAQAVVQISHLQKNFGKFQALKDITFDVHSGEVFGFIGPNGAGKSTTIRALLGILKTNGGQATILGKTSGKMRLQFINELRMCQATSTCGPTFPAVKQSIFS